MKRPIHILNEKTHGSKNRLHSLQTQLAHLDKLTQLALPVLPRGENWQVVSLQHGTLCIAAENFAAMSQLRYLQTHYLKQLQHIESFATITRLKVIIETKPTPKLMHFLPLPELTEPSRQAIAEAAALIQDPELSQALLRLASKK